MKFEKWKPAKIHVYRLKLNPKTGVREREESEKPTITKKRKEKLITDEEEEKYFTPHWYCAVISPYWYNYQPGVEEKEDLENEKEEEQLENEDEVGSGEEEISGKDFDDNFI